MNNNGWRLGLGATYHTYAKCPLLLGHQKRQYKGHSIKLTANILSNLDLCRLCENKEHGNNFLRSRDAT